MDNTKTIKANALIPKKESEYDVIVCGGGPAGLGAALAAARTGAKTLLLESRASLGGVAYAALWMPVNKLLIKDGSRGGIHDLFVSKIKSMGDDAAIRGKENFIDGDGFDIHPDYLKKALFELLEEYRVHYRLYSPVVGAVMEGTDCKGVVVSTKDGPQTFKAGTVVDATGDGDVAFHAGVEMVVGGEEDMEQYMPISLVFAVCDVDVDRFMDYIEENEEKLASIFEKAEQNGYKTSIWYGYDRTALPGVLSINNGGWVGNTNLNGADSKDLTLAERSGINVAVDFVRIMQENKIPGMEKCRLVRTGANVGVRNTRRIVGEYVQTYEDSQESPVFDDMVCRKYGAVDANQVFRGTMASGYGFPYRSMLPKKIDNLLAAGRCCSATFLGHAAGKSMGNMMDMGQAAGVAASLSVKTGIRPRELDSEEIRKVLRSWKVDI